MDTNTEIKYVSSFKRSTALSIDMAIVMFLRIIAAQVLGLLWINSIIENFTIDFREHFGTEIVKRNQEHLEFIISHPAFKQILIFYFIVISIGLFYHAYLNSSAWQATVGKRLMGIMVVKDNHEKISFGTGILHYVLSILPIIFTIYLLALMINNNLTLFHAITYNPVNIFLGFICILWIQIHVFTKRKTTAYDIICKMVFISGRNSLKLPWSK